MCRRDRKGRIQNPGGRRGNLYRSNGVSVCRGKTCTFKPGSPTEGWRHCEARERTEAISDLDFILQVLIKFPVVQNSTSKQEQGHGFVFYSYRVIDYSFFFISTRHGQCSRSIVRLYLLDFMIFYINSPQFGPKHDPIFINLDFLRKNQKK